jgi:membrane protein DedA with SNARE-associated domain
VAQIWPLSRYPEILPRGEAFVKKWGVPSIFIGRFFGPLRASVPLAAGIFEMPYWSFQLANWVSAFVWSAALLLFGDVIGEIIEWLWRTV